MNRAVGQTHWTTRLTRVSPGVVLATISFAVLSTLGLGSKSVWFDEAFSLRFVAGGFAETLSNVWHVEINLALHHLLLSLWTNGGASEIAGRSLSVVFGVATVPVVYALGKALLGERSALFAATLLAVNGFALEWSQQIRGYSMVMFLTAWATHLFVRLVHGKDRYRWSGYALVGAAAAWTHLFGFLILGAHALSLVFLPRDHRREVAPSLVTAYGLVLALTTPIFAFIVINDAGRSSLDRPDLIDVLDAFGAVSGQGGRVLTAAAGLLVAGFAVGTVRLRSQKGASIAAWSRMLIIAWLGVPFVGAIVVSYLLTPLFADRYLIVSLPAVVLMMAAMLRALRPNWSSLLASGLVMALSGLSVVAWHTSPSREDWRQAVSEIAALATPDDAVVLAPEFLLLPWQYYASRFEGELPVAAGLNGSEQQRDRLLGYDRVWFITHRSSTPAEFLDPSVLDRFRPGPVVRPSGLTITRLDSQG